MVVALLDYYFQLFGDFYIVPLLCFFFYFAYNYRHCARAGMHKCTPGKSYII